MKTYIRLFFILPLIVAATEQCAAQYWGERVLEKSFEQTDFFFVPTTVSPYGIGNFKTTSPGLLRDPLLDMIINPALLFIDTSQTAYIYTDLRSSREVENNSNAFPLPWYGVAQQSTADVMYYPGVYLSTRRVLEPVFTGAVIGRPLPSTAQDLLIGLTYQLVMQDEKYYSIPQDIYRTNIGYDYNGMSAAAQSSIPIVDRYNGKDDMHQSGNFLSGFVRYALPVGLEIGVKLSRVMFGRNGSYGSSNLWQFTPSASGSSLWSNIESRDQTYAHWDLSGGVEYRMNEATTVGASAGYLWGNATQALRTNDSSNYSYSSGSNASLYLNSGNTSEEWRHRGKTSYVGLDLISRVSAASSFTLYYTHQGTTADIGLGSSILDTSFSTYAWSNNGTNVISNSHSYLADMRGGSGVQSVSLDRCMASVQWNLDNKVSLSAGVVLEWQNTEINTGESVLVNGRSSYQISDSSYSQTYSQGESKDLFWTFTAKRTSFQVPIFITIKASAVTELLFGLNRTMAQWEINDVTLAMFRYRMSVTNGTVQIDRNFGERYTEPPEKVSDVTTTFLAGLTISPSERLKIRMLMVPNFKDSYQGPELSQLQWWLGVTITP